MKSVKNEFYRKPVQDRQRVVLLMKSVGECWQASRGQHDLRESSRLALHQGTNQVNHHLKYSIYINIKRKPIKTCK